MKVIVTGASGLLGSHLSLQLGELGYEVIGVFNHTHIEIDSCRTVRLDLLDHATVRDFLSREGPDYVIHCAAMTDVNKCELQKSRSYDENVRVTKCLVETCGYLQAKLVYISTPAVFGRDKGPQSLREFDIRSPTNHYAQCKKKAEEIVLNNDNNSVVRLNPFGHSPSSLFLVDWVMESVMKDIPITGFTDHKFNPIFAGNVAKYLDRIIINSLSGIFHLGCRGSLSKFTFIDGVIRAHNVDVSILAKNSVEIDQRDKSGPLRNRFNTIYIDETEKKTKIPFQVFNEELQDFIRFKNVGGYSKIRRVHGPEQVAAKTWVVIPAKNEENTIATVLDELASTFKNVILVDDGSIDSTAKEASSHVSQPTVVRHTHNHGYDPAIQSGFLQAIREGAEFIMTFDADGQHRVEDALKMIEHAAKYDVVVGIRDKKPRITEHIFSYVLRGLSISDPLCGMKLYRAKLFRHATFFDRFGSIGTDLLIHSIAMGYNHKEVKIKVRDREDTSRFGRKLVANIRIASAIKKMLQRYWRKLW